MNRLGATDLEVFPLCLGGNVFGWSAGEEESFAVLDAYTAAGGNFVDTADVYSAWVEGHEGGESETVIGRWLAARGNRESLIVATKVAKHPSRPGLSAANIHAAVDDSLRRLGTDYIDLYYAHHDDLETPLEETLAAFGDLIRAGKVRHVAASNYEPDRLAEAVRLGGVDRRASYVALQPEYNLVARGYENGLRDVCESGGLACLPYFGLARGFLTGKYRPGGAKIDSVRAAGAVIYLDEPRGPRVLEALDEIAATHGVSVAAVALAWLAAQPTVAAPIASARTVAQLEEILPMTTLHLGADEIERLTAASAA